MSLSTRVVDRLYERLMLTYGSQWMALWQGADLNEVKSLWASELSPWANRLDALGWALDHLPERPPNLIAFKALCRQAPAPNVPALPLPERDPQRMQQAMAILRGLTGESDGQPVRVGGKVSGGRTPAQSVIDGLIERGEKRALNPAQVAVLRACASMLNDNDPRLENHVVERWVPRRVAIEEAQA